ncbi:hypothetical protein FRC09_001848 [Ceratobasidium sp. 395]|nr:hypothetical protein FRC09_001848 [Ceratobasidium sp. 395]
MNVLRMIRKWVTRSKTTKLSGIVFNHEENTLQVKVVIAGDAVTGKSNLVWTLSQKAPWVEAGMPPTNMRKPKVADVKTA